MEQAQSGRQQGGQPGHKGHQRSLVPLNKVNSVIVCPPQSHCDCVKAMDVLEQFERHQVFELPTPRYEVIEYQLQTGCVKHADAAIKEASRQALVVRDLVQVLKRW